MSDEKIYHEWMKDGITCNRCGIVLFGEGMVALVDITFDGDKVNCMKGADLRKKNAQLREIMDGLSSILTVEAFNEMDTATLLSLFKLEDVVFSIIENRIDHGQTRGQIERKMKELM